MNKNKKIHYKGFLFVGDPHLTSIKPGSRLDVNFADTVLDKINQAVDIALKENLYLIFLGDLFHTEKENNISLLTKLVKILKKLPEPCASISGNHEKKEVHLTDDVAISLLREAEVLYTLEKNQIWKSFEIENTLIYIGSTPYGLTIPQEIQLPETNNKSFTIWLTHHDLDFGNSYPGVIPLHEIKNVDLLVNGHIHTTKKPQKLGNMIAYNPGNITRMSRDCQEHIPSVWVWKPSLKQTLEPIVLKYEKNIFDMVGFQITAEKIKPVIDEELKPEQTSSFVKAMEQNLINQDPKQTDDGEHLKKMIQTLALALNVDDDFSQEILSLADETIQNQIDNK